MRDRLFLFILSCFLGGLGAFLGSVLGNAAGRTGLFVGAVVGGLVGAVVTGFVARGRRWIRPDQVRSTALGAAIGFLVAATIATQTMGSPVGPVLSTGLVGVGALLGSRVRRDRVA